VYIRSVILRPPVAFSASTRLKRLISGVFNDASYTQDVECTEKVLTTMPSRKQGGQCQCRHASMCTYSLTNIEHADEYAPTQHTRACTCTTYTRAHAYERPSDNRHERVCVPPWRPFPVAAAHFSPQRRRGTAQACPRYDTLVVRVHPVCHPLQSLRKVSLQCSLGFEKETIATMHRRKKSRSKEPVQKQK
jgi:hypothetical protein